MPQMAPISWLFLFILFSSCFILFNVMNYFCFLKPETSFLSNKATTKNNKMSLLNWKW